MQSDIRTPAATKPESAFWVKVKRCYEHALLDRSDVYRLVGDGALQTLATRISASESRHLGEVCMCIESSLPLRAVWDGVTPRQRAEEVFARERVWNTERNNGVLIYFLLADHAIEIVCDRDIAVKTDVAFWQGVLQRLRTAFQDCAYEEGLTEALAEVTAVLMEHYPLKADEVSTNELDDFVLVM